MLFAAAAFAVLIFFAFTSVSAKRSRAVVDQELKNLGSPRLAPRLGKVVICGGGYVDLPDVDGPTPLTCYWQNLWNSGCENLLDTF